VQQTVQVMLQFWFWLTPIVYITDTLPARVADLLHWNPLFPLIRAYQGIFLEQTLPDWTNLIYPGLLGMGFSVLGMIAFYKLQGEIVDAL
jgi:lipopolysaccharide transport system permease protein